MTTIYAVHFMGADFRPQNGREKPWTVGETRAVRGTIALCEKGYHYSPSWESALIGQYLYGPLACIVEVDDSGPKDQHKGVSATRTLVEAFNVERELWLFAADEATRCLKAWEKWSGKPADIRSWQAIKAARLAADGKITPDELSAARSAAESAARSAAESAARSAARNAAWSAARNAAESAAWSAADSAAWSAARNAAWSAARNASAKRFAKVMAEATGWVTA